MGITQAVYPVPQELKSALLLALLQRGDMQDVLVFTRTKHRADRLQKQLVKSGISAERIHGNRSQPQRTEALAGFKSGKYRVLVATDIAARGIDIEALGHVVNFDVPKVPEDYIHRVGRTARAEAVGDAFTFVAPDEEQDFRRIEREVGRRLPRVVVPDFDYAAKPEGKLEVPLAERIAAIRARKAEDRARGRRPRPPATRPRPASRGRRASGRGRGAGSRPGAARTGAGRAERLFFLLRAWRFSRARRSLDEQPCRWPPTHRYAAQIPLAQRPSRAGAAHAPEPKHQRPARRASSCWAAGSAG